MAAASDIERMDLRCVAVVYGCCVCVCVGGGLKITRGPVKHISQPWIVRFWLAQGRE